MGGESASRLWTLKGTVQRLLLTYFTRHQVVAYTIGYVARLGQVSSRFT